MSKKYGINITKNNYLTMNQNDKERVIQELQNDLERVLHFISNCDQKASIVLATFGIVFSIIFSKLEILTRISALFSNVYNSIQNKEYWFTISLVLTILLLVIALYFIIKSFYNIIQAIRGTIDERTDKDSLGQYLFHNNSKIFFGTISNESFSDFMNQRRKATDEERIDELISQLYINAKICKQKFKSYNKGIESFLYYGLPLLCIGLFLCYLFT